MDAQVRLLQQRRTKIVATLGPACSRPELLRELVAAGVDVFRLNLSHGTHASHAQAFETLRAVTDPLVRPVAVLADLCGPKIRTGRFPPGGIVLVAGEPVTVTTRDVEGGQGLIPSGYASLAADARSGTRLLLADGLIELVVERVEGTEIGCTVVHGGRLTDRKGINLPDVVVSAPALTTQDREDARFAVELGVDYLALSFVRDESDVRELRALVGGAPVQIVAKIERAAALDGISGILDAADAIMIARGDLGVELPPEAVPVVQRELISLARAQGKPVIVATQMLESMIEHPQATRAEVSDVSTAVFAGSDAVMLSAETATGAYPVRAVAMMDRIARRVEAWQWAQDVFRVEAAEPVDAIPLYVALARATAQLSRDLRVRAIIVVSDDASTPRIVSSARPAAPLVVVSDQRHRWRQSNLLWGVVPIFVPSRHGDTHELARRLAVELGLAEQGQFILLVTGFAGLEAQQAPAVTALRV